ncbi:KAP family P-loop NTPase fold protein [Maribacter stanieri]|uniref:KAP family P-loop NTPase fold protein n=1 Tax=Maribacter stanieri TaxID=440514 RepID=UPI002495123C|nr:P-loop NTPase fold protein [Maribacter stanieri]
MSKYYRTSLAFIILVVLFYQPLKPIYENIIVNPILSKIRPVFIVDIIHLLIVGLILRKVYLNIKNETYISGHQMFISISIIAFYIYLRCFENYVFFSLTFFDPIKYFDLWFSYFLISPLTRLISIFRNNKESNRSIDNLFNDSPIDNELEDALDRHYKAKRISDEIYQTNANQAIGFGITGQWGSGKTSFLNLIKQEISKKNEDEYLIIIDFNPWLNLGIESIIQDFFDTIQTALRPYSEDIYREIKQYSNSLLNIGKSDITHSIKEILGFAFKRNVTTDFSSLNELLKKLDKRILIFIDDFDRLQSTEIFEILKLIRNTAGFDNFVYLVAYDKAYLNESLKNLNIPKPGNFSEKIFLKEERLTPVTSLQIQTFIKESLVDNISDKKEEIENYFDGGFSLTVNENIIPLNHLRDAKRFLNSFINDYKLIKEEILFSDYFLIKLLKFKFYDVYILLFLNRRRFLTDKGHYYGGGGIKYCLRNKYENESDSETGFGARFRDYNKSVLAQFMIGQLKYSEEEVSKISKLMVKLFEVDQYQQKHHLSIVFPKNYHKYFKDNLSNQDLSEVEFLEAINSPFDNLKKKIEDWHSRKVLELVKYRFYEISLENISTRTQYESVVRAIFYMANLEVQTSFYGRNNFGYDNNALEHLISDRDSKVSNKFYEADSKQLKEFLNVIFTSNSRPYLFESNFLNYVIDNNFNEELFIFTENEIKEILKSYLFNYLSANNNLNYYVWALFHNCKTISNIREGAKYLKKYNYFDGVKEALIEFMKKDLDAFLVNVTDPAPFYGVALEDNVIGVSNGVQTNIFSSFEEFERWLKEIDDEAILKPSVFKNEFLDFFQKFRENKYAKIGFEFSYEPMLDKLKTYNRNA